MWIYPHRESRRVPGEAAIGLTALIAAQADPPPVAAAPLSAREGDGGTSALPGHWGLSIDSESPLTC
jgi:hypothetical protein